MLLSRRFLLAAALLAAFSLQEVHAARKTVCTITVNSADEREAFRRYLPADQYDFVELVERGRPDWLASACRQHVRCDVLLISGHFDGGDEFYSDRVDARESLPVDEMERASCSDSCPGLFSQLKEVYLFGCNTLNAEKLSSTSADVTRALLRSGHSPADAERVAQMLDARHADSNRDKMRMIFKDVPVIYGFSSKAPLGAKAGPMLERYFKSGTASIGSGRPSEKLLGLFAGSSMTVASGSTDTEPQASYRRDMCQFADDRLSPAQRVAFVHSLLGRDVTEVRTFLDPLEKFAASLTPAERADATVAKGLEEIATDAQTSARWLAFARDTDEPAVRARMIALAARFGWLSPSSMQAELARLVHDLYAKNEVGNADVELVCTLNGDDALDAALAGTAPATASRDVAHAALLACAGSAAARAQLIDALTSGRDRDVALAQIYLKHHPIADVGDFRAVALRIARMNDVDAQVRALDTLAEHRVSDRESLESLARLFPVAKTVNVQRAIAGILIRSDYEAIAKPELVRALREKRLKSPDGQDLIDVLIRRMQASLSRAA
ncbi:MAG TPA: hypothetical protein VLN42_07515 [Casimicrobiaceae bacterium]|nr:hypothetical protein [Casimicrobiaceae bacterium]